MKKLISILPFLLFAAITFSQDTTSQLHSKDYYLKKSKNQKTTGWILLGTGTTMGVLGLSGVFNNSLTYSLEDAGAFFLVAGAADLAGIFFLVSAKNNKERAAEVAISNQQIYLPQQNCIAIRYLPALKIQINF